MDLQVLTPDEGHGRGGLRISHHAVLDDQPNVDLRTRGRVRLEAKRDVEPAGWRHRDDVR